MCVCILQAVEAAAAAAQAQSDAAARQAAARYQQLLTDNLQEAARLQELVDKVG